MSKKEIIWRYILTETFEKGTTRFTQQAIATHFGLSTSTVFNSLKAPRGINAISTTGRYFTLIDKEKLLLLWATHRRLSKDIQYSTYIDASASEIEGVMIPQALFGAYSAYKFLYKQAPADYDVVYVYSNDITALKKRFPPTTKKHRNLFILKPDQWLAPDSLITPPAQIFVDLWNLPQWYAKDFLNSLKDKLIK